MRLGEILIAAKTCDEAAIEQGLEHAQFSNNRLGSALIELGLVSSDIIAAALGKQHGISPAREANFASIERDTLDLLTGAQAHARRALPLGIQRSTGELAVAMCDPNDETGIDALREATGKEIIVAAASDHRILKGLIEHYGPADSLPIVPEEEMLDLDLAPSPILTKSTPPPEINQETLATYNPPSPELAPGPPLPEAKVANPAPRFDIREFLGTGRGIVAAAVAGIALLALGKCTYNWLTDKDIPVSGHFEADQVDLQMTLPSTGWIYAPSEDQSESAGFAEVNLAVLYRGDSVKAPDDLLVLLRVTGPFPPTVSEHEFQELIQGLNAGAGGQMSTGGFLALDHECEMSERRDDLTAECVGTVEYLATHYEFDAFLWFEDRSIIAAVFLTKGEFASFDNEIGSIIQSISAQ